MPAEVAAVELTGWAHGGEAVGRLDGKAVFVAGGIPGERVAVRVVTDKGSWARAELVGVLDASPDRAEPPCPAFGTCGGCQWQYVSYERQLEAKREIVASQLRHLGGIDDVEMQPTVPSPAPYGYRNRMSFRVVDGRPAMFRKRSRDLVPIDACLLLEPGLQRLFGRLGDLTGIRRLTLRTGVRTGDRLVVVEGVVPEDASTWGSAVARRSGRRLSPVLGRPFITELVDTTRFRITGDGFFQVNTDGAEALVAAVREVLEPVSGAALLDGYAGAGLFAATVGANAGTVTAVETSGQSIADLRVNAPTAKVLRGRFEDLTYARHDLAVVDPPRAGLGEAGVAAVIRAEPERLAYVSCDPAALARDARLLQSVGYRLVSVTPVDLFPQTWHIEAVAGFVRREGK